MSGWHGPIPESRFLPYRTAEEVRRLAEEGQAVVLLPVGATEQHGPHLPLFTDTTIAWEILGRALQRLPASLPAVALPPVWCGKSNEHLRFPGTISLRAETLTAVLWDIGESLYRSGFRKLVFVNGHGGQPQVLEIVARDLREQFPDFALFPASVWSVPNRVAEFLDERERALGMHAGQVETSLMLALDASHVSFERALCEYPPEAEPLLTPEGQLRYAWLAHDLSRSGVMGDATRADRDQGEAILASLVDGWVEAIGAIHRFRMPFEAP